MEAYSEYARNIPLSVIEEIIGDPNFKYSKYVFSPMLDEKPYKDALEQAIRKGGTVDPNDHFSIKAHS